MSTFNNQEMFALHSEMINETNFHALLNDACTKPLPDNNNAVTNQLVNLSEIDDSEAINFLIANLDAVKADDLMYESSIMDSFFQNSFGNGFVPSIPDSTVEDANNNLQYTTLESFYGSDVPYRNYYSDSGETQQVTPLSRSQSYMQTEVEPLSPIYTATWKIQESPNDYPIINVQVQNYSESKIFTEPSSSYSYSSNCSASLASSLSPFSSWSLSSPVTSENQWFSSVPSASPSTSSSSSRSKSKSKRGRKSKPWDSHDYTERLLKSAKTEQERTQIKNNIASGKYRSRISAERQQQEEMIKSLEARNVRLLAKINKNIAYFQRAQELFPYMNLSMYTV